MYAIRSLMACALLFITTMLYAETNTHKTPATACCSGGLGGISYCDSSTDQYVCKSGAVSTCFCGRHAVMDLQRLVGCCIWHGGVLKTAYQLVVCNDGSTSEECSLREVPERVSAW